MASIDLFRKRFPILTHPSFLGLKISSRSCLLGKVIFVPGIGGIAGMIDCPFLRFSKNPKIPICAVNVLSLLFNSAISVLSEASSKFLTSVNAALDTEDFSTNPRISPSSELILIYSPTGKALEVIAVIIVGFDSPITKPKLNLIPPVNLFRYLILTNLPSLQVLYQIFYSYCVQALGHMDIHLHWSYTIYS